MDLRAEWDTIGCRRLSVLVRGLPPDSAFNRRGRKWTDALEIAALTLERAEMWHRIAVGMQADKQSQGKLPKPIGIQHTDRPVQEVKKNVVRGPGEAAALMQRLAGRR